jgi:glycosyltransferase involved in cell wall biosynthesis
MSTPARDGRSVLVDPPSASQSGLSEPQSDHDARAAEVEPLELRERSAVPGTAALNNGPVSEAQLDRDARAAEVYPMESKERPSVADTAPLDHGPPGQPVLAVFCYEDPDSFVGQYVSWTAAILARHGTTVHLFARRPFADGVPGVFSHAVGQCAGHDLLGSVREFTRLACDAFGRQFGSGSNGVALLAHDWSAVSAALSLKAIHGLEVVVEYHSVERQRSDVSSETARHIAEIELAGLREARTILVHQPATRDCACGMLPDCAGRIEDAHQPFPVHLFCSQLDPGEVKARFQVGPTDPTILYVGDLCEQYGSDLLVKAMPALLRNHSQLRLVIVGSGSEYWPMRVYSRYLLLDHATRFAGDIQDQPLRELIQAADIVAVPSREPTPWWPILAAWASQRPVVATHQAAPPLLQHEQDSVLIYPNEASLVWGIERVLFDPEFGRSIAQQGRRKLLSRFGENVTAEQIKRLMRVTTA